MVTQKQQGIKKQLTKGFVKVAIIGAIAAVIGIVALLIAAIQYVKALSQYGLHREISVNRSRHFRRAEARYVQ